MSKPSTASAKPPRERRAVLSMILASALLAMSARPAWPQRASTTPRGTGRPKLARSAQLPLAADLELDGRTSARERKPLLLFFDREECPYCERALREYVVPLSRDAWRNRVLFRQIEIDEPLALVDFDGNATTHDRFAASMGVSLAPTVLVVDGAGGVLSGPLVGLMTVDFYGAYLERALDDASKKLAG